MPKKGKRDSAFAVLPFTSSQALSTLADGTVLLSNITGTLVDPFHAISMDINWTLRGGTVGEGPIEVGVAHGDYSTTEVSEALNAGQTIVGRNVDMIEKEQARRLVRLAGAFDGQLANDDINDGKMQRVKMGWTIGTGKTLNVFEINRSGSALTGGQVVEFSGKIYGRWL